MAKDYFPYEDHKDRIHKYERNDDLFLGKHFEVFSDVINDWRYNKDYEKLKYIVANFAGMISKVSADMLFSEPVGIKVQDKANQQFIDSLVFQNHLHAQNYESALGNSRHGDAIYKIRIGKLNPGDEDTSVIIEDVTPSIYYPQLNNGNMREEPEVQELCWKVQIEGDKREFLRKEIHRAGSITNELYLLESNKIKQQMDLSILGEDIPEFVETGINKSLVIHIPNWRDGSTYFGYDDYQDLYSLFYAINNRFTKTENILDKHSDPILALPEGVLDEDGNVRKESFHMFEIPSDGVGTAPKPEYITWNASLEANFKHIEKLVEMLFLFSETSPDVFGMGNNGGKEVSGRALKLRLMRTLAKISRKRTYYDIGLKQVISVAMELANRHKIGVFNEANGKYDIKPSSVEIPRLQWQDGLPIDQHELIEDETAKLNAGLQSTVESIMVIDGIEREEAEQKAKEIDEERSINIPEANPVINEVEEDEEAEEDE